MKAICIKRISKYYNEDSFLIIEKGDIIDYTVKDIIGVKMFVIKDNIELLPPKFFTYFKVIEGDEKLCYSDFEYILCNYEFRNAVLFPHEYSGVRHLIIQVNNDEIIMITINRDENIIRVSFNDVQEKYTNYEDALEGIRNHYNPEG